MTETFAVITEHGEHSKGTGGQWHRIKSVHLLWSDKTATKISVSLRFFSFHINCLPVPPLYKFILSSPFSPCQFLYLQQIPLFVCYYLQQFSSIHSGPDCVLYLSAIHFTWPAYFGHFSAFSLSDLFLPVGLRVPGLDPYLPEVKQFF